MSSHFVIEDVKNYGCQQLDYQRGDNQTSQRNLRFGEVGFLIRVALTSLDEAKIPHLSASEEDNDGQVVQPHQRNDYASQPRVGDLLLNFQRHKSVQGNVGRDDRAYYARDVNAQETCNTSRFISEEFRDDDTDGIGSKIQA